MSCFLLQFYSNVVKNLLPSKWRVDGKISYISRNNGSGKSELAFVYDAMGNRVEKTVNNDAGAWSETEYYVRDAQGNVMAIYKKNVTSGQMNYILTEQHIYGSARLGIDRRGVDVIASSTVTDNVSRSIKRGEKHYELSNHLGNVLATVSDKKIAVMSGANLSYYRADVVSYSDYYPFGAPMTERTAVVTPTDVRYGYGGHEKDDEVKGTGNHLSFGDYGYDPRTGRRWNIDPIEQEDVSGYAVFNNDPIYFNDPDGESPISAFAKAVAKAGLKKAAKETVEAAIKKRLSSYMSNKWARQLADDALTAIDLATSTAWWEYAIELVPIVGDIYGASQLGKQGYAVYKLTQKFESAAEWAGKAAGKAWNTLGPNKVVGKGADKIAEYTTKFNNRGKGLTEDDLAGAVKEIYGLNSGVKANGTPYKHLKEVTEHLSGMKTQMNNLKRDIDAGLFDGDALKAAQGILNNVTKQYNEISNTLNSARKAAKEVTQ